MSNCLTYYRYVHGSKPKQLSITYSETSWLTDYDFFSLYCGYCFATDKRLCQLFLAFGIYDCFRSSFCCWSRHFIGCFLQKETLKTNPFLSLFIFVARWQPQSLLYCVDFVDSFHFTLNKSFISMNNFSLLYTLEFKKLVDISKLQMIFLLNLENLSQ